MLQIIDFLTFVWLSLCLLFVISRLSKGYNDVILFVYMVYYIFFATPLLLDLVFGIPNYYIYPGFRDSSGDFLTAYIYSIYISVVPVIWLLTTKLNKKQRKLDSFDVNNRFIKRTYPIFYFLLFIPIIAVLFSPNPMLYLEYGAAANGLFINESESYHFVVNLSVNLSVISIICLLIFRDNKIPKYIILLSPIMFICIWINGKRAIVAVLAVAIGYILWNKGYLRGVKFYISIVLAAIIFALFTSIYQFNLRYESLGINNFSDIYENIRVDFGRDAVTKFSINRTLYPEKGEIVEFAGQSFLFDLTMYVPREFWANKPWPYAVYMTAAIFGLPPDYIGWGVTTSILEEAISNFGWFGMLIGPLMVSLICRWGERCNHELIYLMTVLVASLFLVLQLAAFANMFFLWVILILTLRKRKSKLVG
ncbi:oligosaccharide repeat unit polymerase [Paenibacillus sp. N4]|uniref:O-antigen polymerase n=1 Tax=Paenibacillus vietnamensis TaxID=2590547 RepID=UPI001CD167BA|nr:O-antigen polymerase [Paenibacillus vietnamensis]MCA0756492.1 oligosaccharide repeat unit polymerase [Paenibacillus vietnamensis]